MLKVSRMPRQMQWRQCDPVRRQASADIYAVTESAMPATQIEAEMLKVSRMPRQMQWRQCHPVRRQASADIYAVTESVMPVTVVVVVVVVVIVVVVVGEERGRRRSGTRSREMQQQKQKDPQDNVGNDPVLRSSFVQLFDMLLLICLKRARGGK